MAKKKSKRRKRYTKKTRTVKKDRATPLGVAAGATGTGIEMMFVRNPVYFDPFTYLKTLDIKSASASLLANAKDIDRYKYAAAGIIVSASPKIPLVSLFAKPADKAIRRLSKGKVSL